MIIMRATEIDGQWSQTPLSGSYRDRQEAEQELANGILPDYARSGYESEHDYWWARSDHGSLVRFFIN